MPDATEGPKSLSDHFQTAYKMDLPPRTPQPELTGTQTADVMVMGGGFSGLTTALELAKKGYKVILAEAGEIAGAGASGRNGGQVIPGFDWSMTEIAETYGQDKAQALWNDVEGARARVHERIDSEKDKCDSSQGVIAAAMTQEQLDDSRTEVEDLKKFGYTQAAFLDKDAINQQISSPKYLGGYMFKDARHINPEKYVRHLADLALAAGVKIAEHSPVETYKENADGTFTVTTPKATVTAKNMVVAGGATLHRPKGLDDDTIPRTFEKTETVILATEKLSPNLLKAAVPGTASWYDLRHSMNYARVLNGRILFGGADALGQLQLAFSIAALKKDLYETLPVLKDAGVKVEKIWTGTVDVSQTMLPSVRRVKPGLYEASGFSGQGLVLTGLAGETIAEDIATGGHSERLARLSSIAPEAFPKNALLSKLKFAAEFLPAVIKDSLDLRRQKKAEKAQPKMA